MIQDVIIKKLNKFTDERGWLTEFWRNDDIDLKDYKPTMSYVSVTKPGQVRGPHEHKEQSDCFVFIGPGSFELYLWDKEENHEKIEVGENNPTLVIVPPRIVHGYKCISETEGWCINMPDKLYRGKGKQEEIDEIRWEDNPNSPYKII